MHLSEELVASWAPLAAVTCIVALFLFMRSMASPLRALPLPPGPPWAPQSPDGYLGTYPSCQPLKLGKHMQSGPPNLAGIPSIVLFHLHSNKPTGSVMHLRVYRQHLILLSSRDDCIELFEKRSNLYSDKPTFTMLDLSDVLGLQRRFDAIWAEVEKAPTYISTTLQKTASLSYRPEQTRKVIDMLHGLLTSPKDFRDHVQTVTAAIAMSTAYGYDIQPKKDYFVSLAADAVSRLSFVMLPGAALVNSIPIMRHLPSWFPGAGFQRIAAETREITRQMREVPFKWAEDNIAAGLSSECLVASLLRSCQTEDDIVTVREVAAMVHAAGADTTTPVLETFFYAMAIYDDVQRRAQQEIDAIVGRERLLIYGDWPSLPYTEALLREILRWRPPTPVIPGHRSKEDDVFKGYLIPKEAFLMINIWAITHDAYKYKDPEEFIPDRFVDENGQLDDDDMDFVFGFSRRICPGRHMARATLWLSMVMTLWAFKISKAKDDSGNEIPISGGYTDGVVSHPLRHACLIVPRFPEVEKVVKEASFQAKNIGV